MVQKIFQYLEVTSVTDRQALS